MSKTKKIQETKRGLLDTSNDDFESPMVFKKFKQPSKNATTATKRSKTKKANNKKQLTLHQVYDENFRYSDVNPEHLQLALALSRSSSEIHNCHTNEEFPLTSQTEGKKRTLLEFGFRTNRPKMSVDNKILKKEPLKTNKKSKYRFVTPILMMRTEEERESLIQSKLSSIFVHNIDDSVAHENLDIEVSSEELQNIRCRSCSIFNLCRRILSQEEEQLRVSHLNIEGTRAKSGSLLKDWKKIPSRDHTPERSNLGNSTSISEILTTAATFKKGETSENMSQQKTDLNSEKFNSLEVEGNCESSKSSMLSIDHKYGAVSPDLFDDASFSEDHLSSSLHDVSIKVRKKLSNMFEKEDMDEKTPSRNFHSDFYHEDEKLEVHTSHNPEKRTESQYVEGNSQQSVSTSPKSNFQEFFRNDLSQVPDAKTIVLSSDEELSNLETNSSRLCSEAKNSTGSLNNSVPSHKENSHEISTDHFDLLKNESSKHEKSESDKKSKNLYCLDDEDIDFPSMVENFDEKTENFEEIVVSSDEEYLNKDQLSNNDSSKNSVAFFDEESKISKSHTSDKPDLSKLSSLSRKYDSTNEEDIGSDEKATNFSKDIHNILGKSVNDSLGEKLGLVNELKLSEYFNKYDLKEGSNEQNNSFENSFKSISPEKHNTSQCRTKYDGDILNSSYKNENVKNDNISSSNSEISDSKGHEKHSDSSYNSLNFDDTNYKFSDTFDEYLPEIPKSIQGRFSENSSNHKLYTSSPAQEPREKYDLSDFKLYSSNNEDQNCQNPTSFAKRISGICEKPKEIFSDSLSDSILDEVFKENSLNSGNDSKTNLQFGSDTEEKHFLFDELPIKQKKEDKYVNLSNSSLISNKSIDQQIDVNVNIQSVQNTPDKNLKQTPNTPFRRYASFSQTETPKSSVPFMRHKSESNITPNNKFIIKTENVTPMVDYNAFSTPEIVKELGKFGLKPLKRKRGINLLKHIYETTHPKVEMPQKETEEMPIIKKRKSNENQTKAVDNIGTYQDKNGLEMLRGWSDTISDSDAILERRPSSKMPTCQVPLQIVWHNFLTENPEILENILLYEPLQVEVIHKMIKDIGYKFHIEDLISFFDQKCITIRVAQNNRRR